jgi:hypothetical protein
MAFNFSNASVTTTTGPSFGFGAPTTTATGFSFGQPATTAPTLNTGLFASNTTTLAAPPAFGNLGQTTIQAPRFVVQTWKFNELIAM